MRVGAPHCTKGKRILVLTLQRKVNQQTPQSPKRLEK